MDVVKTTKKTKAWVAGSKLAKIKENSPLAKKERLAPYGNPLAKPIKPGTPIGGYELCDQGKQKQGD